MGVSKIQIPLKHIYYLLCALLLFSCQTKNKKTDTISDLSEPMDSILELVSNEELPREQKIKILDSLSQIIIEGKNDTISRMNMIQVANQYFYINEIEKYLVSSQKIIEMGQEAKDTVDIARGYQYLGDYYTDRSDSDSAYYSFTQSEKLYAKTDDRENFGRAKLKKAYLILKVNDLSLCEAIGIEVLKIAHEVKDLTLEYESYSFLSAVLTAENKYEEAIKYNNKALETLKEFKDDPQYFSILTSQTYNSL